MGFEEEVIYLLVIGFTLVMALVITATALFVRKVNRQAYNAFIGQIFCLCLAFFFLLRLLFPNFFCIETDPRISIPSISNSVNIGLCGISWAISMGFCLKGIFVLAKIESTKSED